MKMIVILNCIIIAGPHKGGGVDIPPIMFQYGHDSDCKLDFTKKQFPMRVCFSMIIWNLRTKPLRRRLEYICPKICLVMDSSTWHYPDVQIYLI